jgi:hypothetical protein
MTKHVKEPASLGPSNTVLVIHRDPGRYDDFRRSTKADPFYVIGRSMYETDSIPQVSYPSSFFVTLRFLSFLFSSTLLLSELDRELQL